MPIFRGPSGDIQHSDENQPSTRKINRNTQESGDERDENISSVNTDEPETQVLYQRSSNDNVKEITKTNDTMSDPVVGWLVITNGPGKGEALQLGYGMNSIGRSKTERICLDFGDEEISRTQHAIVIYDPRGRKFYVQHGGGKNLTYLNKQPLLVPAELHGNEDILLGQTNLRFIPLCGENFDWQNN